MGSLLRGSSGAGRGVTPSTRPRQRRSVHSRRALGVPGRPRLVVAQEPSTRAGGHEPWTPRPRRERPRRPPAADVRSLAARPRAPRWTRGDPLGPAPTPRVSGAGPVGVVHGPPLFRAARRAWTRASTPTSAGGGSTACPSTRARTTRAARAAPPAPPERAGTAAGAAREPPDPDAGPAPARRPPGPRASRRRASVPTARRLPCPARGRSLSGRPPLLDAGEAGRGGPRGGRGARGGRRGARGPREAGRGRGG